MLQTVAVIKFQVPIEFLQTHRKFSKKPYQFEDTLKTPSLLKGFRRRFLPLQNNHPFDTNRIAVAKTEEINACGQLTHRQLLLISCEFIAP